MYLLDTNVCVYFMKNTYPALTRQFMSYDPSELLISSITVFELEYGAAKSRWGEKTHNNMLLFLAPFTILPFTEEDAFAAGKVRGILEGKGQIIGSYDLLIASQGLVRNLTVITHNTREFNRVPDLRVEDWVPAEQ